MHPFSDIPSGIDWSAEYETGLYRQPHSCSDQASQVEAVGNHSHHGRMVEWEKHSSAQRDPQLWGSLVASQDSISNEYSLSVRVENNHDKSQSAQSVDGETPSSQGGSPSPPRHAGGQQITFYNNPPYDQQEIFPADTLAARFAGDYDYQKGTNIPKYLIRLFFSQANNFIRQLPVNRELPNHISLLKRIESSVVSCFGVTKNLKELFGDEQNSDVRKRWAKHHREHFQRQLCSGQVMVTILKSKSLKEKVHYLYSVRVYTWRLNDGRLVGKLN